MTTLRTEPLPAIEGEVLIGETSSTSYVARVYAFLTTRGSPRIRIELFPIGVPNGRRSVVVHPKLLCSLIPLLQRALELAPRGRKDRNTQP